MTTLGQPLRWSSVISNVLLTALLAMAITAVSTGCATTERDDESSENSLSNSSMSDDEVQLSSSQASQDGEPSAQASESVSDDLANEELGVANKPVAKSAKAELPAAQAAPEQQKFSGNYSEVSVTDIKYAARQGAGTVIIETSATATYHTREVPAQNQAIIEIANAQLPERLKRPYITKDFGQPIASIMAYQDKGSTTVRVVVQFKGPMHTEVHQSGRDLTLSTSEALAEVDDDPTLGSDRPRGAAAPGDSESGGKRLSIANDRNYDTRILPGSSEDSAGYDNLKFYGKPISLEVRDASVRDVINLIAEQSGANIVLSGDVEGTISMKIRQIPWDQALLIVMKTRNLGYVRQGSILRVAPYKNLKEETDSARQVIEAQKNAEPLRVKIIPVGYAKVDALKDQILPFLTEKRGKIVGDIRTNSLVITDTPDVLARVGNLVKALDLPPLQVLIEGKVVEAREAFERHFGIKWNFSGLPLAMGKQQLSQSLDINLPVPQAGGLYNFRFGQFDILGDIQATLGLAEQEDQIHIVSSPRVVALNNEKATIVQGTNIPVQTTTLGQGSTTTSVTYLPIEMRLEVTPQVTSENDVIMNISIKRDFAAKRVAGTQPDINRREAVTKVLVRNGQTAVVGGVYQSDTDAVENGIPWVKNLPVIGWLFKSKDWTKEKSEMLVFLTPRILNAETSMQKENTL